MTPKVSFIARCARYLLILAARRFFVGPTRVIGRQSLKSYKGRFIGACNHQTERDAIVLPPELGLRNARALMAVNQIQGKRLPLAAWQGIVAVHHDSNPMAAVNTSVDCLNEEKDLCMIVFPQGSLIRDNVLVREQFFAGVITIAKHGQKKSSKDDPVMAILPSAIAYDRDPAHKDWIHTLLERFNRADVREFYDETIYGATVAHGKPILFEDLPKNREKAMDIIFDEIVRLSKMAEESLTGESWKQYRRKRRQKVCAAWCGAIFLAIGSIALLMQ